MLDVLVLVQTAFVSDKINKHYFEVTGDNEQLCITVLSTICTNVETPTPIIIYPRKRLGEQMSWHLASRTTAFWTHILTNRYRAIPWNT